MIVGLTQIFSEAILRARRRRGSECTRASHKPSENACPARALHTSHHAHCKTILVTTCAGAEVEYLVKWLNWPESDCTWEKEGALECAVDVLKDQPMGDI